MAMFSVRVPDDVAGRFDRKAQLRGGRSAALRRLIVEAAADGLQQPGRSDTPSAPVRLMVRLRPPVAVHVAREAAALQLRPSGWVASLVARHADAGVRFSRIEEQAFASVQADLRRIGVNINQIARALNTAVLEGRVLDLELQAIEAFQREIRGHLAAVQAAAAGQSLYWAAKP